MELVEGKEGKFFWTDICICCGIPQEFRGRAEARVQGSRLQDAEGQGQGRPGQVRQGEHRTAGGQGDKRTVLESQQLNRKNDIAARKEILEDCRHRIMQYFLPEKTFLGSRGHIYIFLRFRTTYLST